MKEIRYIMTAIAVLSIAGCFGFTAAAAQPESEWDGSSALRNNRTYVLSSSAELEESLVIPEDTVLTLREGASITVNDGTELIIEGGLNLQVGSSLFSDSTVSVEKSGTLSVYGSVETSEDADVDIEGLLDIRPMGQVKLYSDNVIGESGRVSNGGQLLLERYSRTEQSGALYIENDGKIMVGGEMNVTAAGIFDSSGEVVIERKGGIHVSGNMNLRDGSVLTAAGAVVQEENGTVTDLAFHTDLSIYSSKPLKQEDHVVLRGIDVSWVQGEIDWPVVAKSGIDFAIIRAGRGDIDGTGPSMDTYFLQNIEGALENDMDVGVYFYSYAHNAEQAETEARFFASLLDGYEITYPVIMDFEEELEDDIDLSEIAEAFLETVAEYGYYPMIYSYKARLDNAIDSEITEKYAVWVAQFGSDQPETDYEYYIWQYSHEGRINGIEGDVDFNVAYRDFPDILRYYGLNKLTPESEE